MLDQVCPILSTAVLDYTLFVYTRRAKLELSTGAKNIE